MVQDFQSNIHEYTDSTGGGGIQISMRIAVQECSRVVGVTGIHGYVHGKLYIAFSAIRGIQVFVYGNNGYKILYHT